MPRKLNMADKTRALWAAPYWRVSERNRFLNCLVDTGTTVINVGPRGGCTWGPYALENRSYQILKSELERRRFILIEDRVTKKVHIRM